MSIFGQVWLWSAAAFVVGVLLTWLFLARPAQARSRHLERRLLAAQSAPAAQPTRTIERDPVSAPVARKERVAAETPEAEGHHATPSWLERDSLAGRSPGYQPGSEIDDDSLFEPEEPQADETTVFNAFGHERDDAAERGALYVGDAGLGREQVAGYGREESERGALFEPGETAGHGQAAEQDAAGHGQEPERGEAAGYDQVAEQDDAGYRQEFEQESRYGQGEAAAYGQVADQDDAGAERTPRHEQSEEPAGRGSLFEQEQAAPSAFEQEQPAGSLFQRDESPAERTTLFQPDPALRGEERGSFEPDQTRQEERGSLFGRERAPEPERGSLFDPDHAPAPARAEESAFTPFAAAEPEPPAYAFDDQPQPPTEETATETTQVLPKRQPRRSAHAFDPPKPVQPSMRTVERREPRPEEGGRSGSLFEPTPRTRADGSVPPGPFGPGSAMPRPGGGKPSEEFTVKASVTALRYCTEDSPQYGRMIAEVWFRTADDAERVGFRPL
ncbi:sunset domain-containing protein [Amycolatopsis thermoflava]